MIPIAATTTARGSAGPARPAAPVRPARRGRAPAALAAAALLAVAGCEPSSPSPGGGAEVPSDAGRRSARVEVRVAEAVEAAETWLVQGDADRAESILVPVVRDVPDDPRVQELLGRAALLRATEAERAGRTSAAADLRRIAGDRYLEAARLAAGDAGLQHAAGIALLSDGRSDEAAICFERAAALRPSAAVHPLYAAQARLQGGDLEAAGTLLARALELDPDEPVALASLAVVRLEQGEGDAALAAIGEARGLDPDDLQLRGQQARILRRLGRPRDGLALLLAVPAADRITAGLTAEAAACRRALGEPDEAARLWEVHHDRAETGGDRFRAAVEAATAWIDAGRPDRARRWLDAARVAVRSPEEAARLAGVRRRIEED